MKLWDTCVAQYQGLVLVFCEKSMYQCWSVPEKILNVLKNNTRHAGACKNADTAPLKHLLSKILLKWPAFSDRTTQIQFLIVHPPNIYT